MSFITYNIHPMIIIFKWDLVCDRANLAALAQSLALAGQGLGALIMSHIADRFGRKTVHVLSHLGVMASMILMSFSTNIIMLLTLRLVVGTFQQVNISLCTRTKWWQTVLFPSNIKNIYVRYLLTLFTNFLG